MKRILSAILHWLLSHDKNTKFAITTVTSDGVLKSASVDYVVGGKLIHMHTFDNIQDALSCYNLVTK